MNIESKLRFDPDMPAVVSIKKTDKINVIAVGLLKSQLLKKHKTSIPTLLIVLQGELAFKIEGETIPLTQMDTFNIPVGIVHEVEGLGAQNIFTLTQEK